MMSAVFPDIEVSLLLQLLEAHNENVEAAISALLETFSGTEEDQNQKDIFAARQAQLESDAEVAAALQQKLNAEAGDVQQQPRRARAATTVASISGTTKSLLHRVFPVRRNRPETATRLLDTGTADSASVPEETCEAQVFDSRALEYSPPAPSTPPSPPAAEHTSKSASTERLYNSRIERARASNQLRSAPMPQPVALQPLETDQQTVLDSQPKIAADGPAVGVLIE